MTSRPLLAALAALLGACCPYTPRDCLAVVENACVVLDTDDPATVTEADLARVDAVLVEGGRFWNVDPARELRGWTIVLHGSRRDVCNGDASTGCCYGECHRIDLAPPDAPWDGCIEWAAPHELGHVAIDDSEHEDPRWKTLPRFCGSQRMTP